MSDLISRAELIKGMKECLSYNDYEWALYADSIIEEHIEKAPSVSAERVGEWQYEKMVMPLSNHTKDSYRCSVCHTHWDCETNYCPNCGAKMKGGTE